MMINNSLTYAVVKEQNRILQFEGQCFIGQLSILDWIGCFILYMNEHSCFWWRTYLVQDDNEVHQFTLLFHGNVIRSEQNDNLFFWSKNISRKSKPMNLQELYNNKIKCSFGETKDEAD